MWMVRILLYIWVIMEPATMSVTLHKGTGCMLFLLRPVIWMKVSFNQSLITASQFLTNCCSMAYRLIRKHVILICWIFLKTPRFTWMAMLWRIGFPSLKMTVFILQNTLIRQLYLILIHPQTLPLDSIISVIAEMMIIRLAILPPAKVIQLMLSWIILLSIWSLTVIVQRTWQSIPVWVWYLFPEAILIRWLMEPVLAGLYQMVRFTTMVLNGTVFTVNSRLLPKQIWL